MKETVQEHWLEIDLAGRYYDKELIWRRRAGANIHPAQNPRLVLALSLATLVLLLVMLSGAFATTL